MGWLETPEQRRRQYLQMVATGSIKDVDRIQERDRTRKINYLFWFFFVIFALLGILSLKYLHKGYWLIGISLLILIILIFRYGWHKELRNAKRSRKRKKSNDWERINQLPEWTYKKMKRRKTNRVNGDHYVYKKEGKKYYRKKK